VPVFSHPHPNKQADSQWRGGVGVSNSPQPIHVMNSQRQFGWGVKLPRAHSVPATPMTARRGESSNQGSPSWLTV
jgi:hypothetical protein